VTVVDAGSSSAPLSTRASGVTGFVATLLAFVAIARLGLNEPGVVAAFACAVLVVLSAIDIQRHVLPNRIVLPSAAIVLVAQLAFRPEDWASWVGGAFGAAALFFVARLFYPSGLGLGDVKLAFLLGGALGTDVIPALTLGTFAAAAFGIALIVSRGSSARKAAIPYGPFLSFGAIVVLLLG
jgi:leader peptidase (prepilin peptidase) / N-methyltransferase